MSYENLNRNERRALAAFARSEAARRPAVMTEIPRSRWPAHFKSDPAAPIKAWESRRYLAQLYDGGSREDRTVLRLSICRVTLKDDGKWEEDLTWEELMAVKSECGFRETYAVEVYPAVAEIVNVANMRHLWLLSTPLTIGWFRDAPTVSGAE